VCSSHTLSRYTDTGTATVALAAQAGRSAWPEVLASLDHRAGPLYVTAPCVEWEPEYTDDQLAQTRALAKLLLDPALDGPLPVVLAADLNAPPGSPEVRALTDVMVDTWVAGGGDPLGVTLSSRNPFAPPEARRQIDRRVDYVLARPGTSGRAVVVERAFAVETPVDGLPPSDHYPVVVDLLV
jgi:endonuclease/exonuclease/phosphatase family metal-dependent hydrolase